jgi:hypothetical protein
VSRLIVLFVLAASAAAIAGSSQWNGPIDPAEPGMRAPFVIPDDEDVVAPPEADTRSPGQGAGQDWEQDVLVSDRDSVVEVRLESHSNGRIYCVYRHLGDGYTNSWRVAHSSAGTTWIQGTGILSNYAYPTFDIACCGRHVYVAYPYGTAQNKIWLRRIIASTGALDTFPGGLSSLSVDTFPTGTTIVDVALISNRYYYDNMLYVGAITSDHNMHFYKMDTVSFNISALGRGLYPNDAENGLDACWHEGFQMSGGYPVLFSYINTSGNIRVYGFTYSAPDTHRLPVNYATNGAYTGIAAWKDTFIVVFDNPGLDQQARYVTSYNNGASWLWGAFGDTTQATVRSADVTARNGDGEGVVFWQYPTHIGGISFTWRPYTGLWSAPVRVQNQSSYANRMPAIERIAPGVHGIVYIAAINNGKVYFDRSDWTGINEQAEGRRVRAEPGIPTIVGGTLRLGQNGDRPSSGGTVPVLLDITGRKVMDLQPGANDIRHLTPGIYFVRPAESGARSAVTKVVIQR